MSIQFMSGKESFKLLDYSQHGVFVLDSSMTVLFWNKELENWTGIYTKEIVGKKIGAFFPYLEAEPFKSDLKKVFAGAGSKIYNSRKGQTVIAHKSDSGQPITQRTIVTGMDSDTEGQFLALFTLKDIHAASEGNVAESEAGKGTILVIDDEESIRLAVSRVLASRGHGVHVSKSGEDALEYIDQEIDDLKAIILDLMMPGMNGQETLPYLRNKLPEVPIIACTGMPLKEFDAQDIEKFVQGVVHKPFAVNELLEALDTAQTVEIVPIPLSPEATEKVKASKPKGLPKPSPTAKATPDVKPASKDPKTPLVSASQLAAKPGAMTEAMNKNQDAVLAASPSQEVESPKDDALQMSDQKKGVVTEVEKVVVTPPSSGTKSTLRLKR